MKGMLSSSECDSSYLVQRNSVVGVRFIGQMQKERKQGFTPLCTFTLTIDLNLLLRCDSGKGHVEMEWVLGFRTRARLTVSNIVQVRSNGLYLSAWPALQCADRRLDAVLLFLTLNTGRHHTHLLPLQQTHTHSTVSSYILSHMCYINTQTDSHMHEYAQKQTQYTHLLLMAHAHTETCTFMNNMYYR